MGHTSHKTKLTLVLHVKSVCTAHSNVCNYLFFSFSLHSTNSSFVNIKNFLGFILLLFLLSQHFLCFWHNFPTFDTLSQLLIHSISLWHTFSTFVTLSHTFAHFLKLYHTFKLSEHFHLPSVINYKAITLPPSRNRPKTFLVLSCYVAKKQQRNAHLENRKNLQFMGVRRLFSRG
jgi:hypothetical protein